MQLVSEVHHYLHDARAAAGVDAGEIVVTAAACWSLIWISGAFPRRNGGSSDTNACHFRCRSLTIRHAHDHRQDGSALHHHWIVPAPALV